MRIAIWHNLPSGGGKRALFDHVSGLLERGHVVEAWCPTTEEQPYLALSALIPEHTVPLDRQRGTRWSAVRELLTDERADIAAMDRHCRRCAAEMADIGFDVLFANACTLFRTTAIGRFSPMPAVLYLQEPYRWLYEAMPELPWAAPPRGQHWWRSPTQVRRSVHDAVATRRLRVQMREEIRNARAFGRILVNSLFSRESVLRAYGLDATVCYLSVNERRFSPTADPRQPYFVTVGAAVWEKNVPFLIEALALRQGGQLPLIWVANVADDEEVARVRGLATRLGVDVQIRTAVSESVLVGIVQHATALLYAPRLEPFGLAPLEAAACATPVVAVAEGGVRETVIDGVTGLLVDGNPLEFARALDRLLDDPALARRLGAGGRKTVEERWSHQSGTTRLEEQLVAAIAAHLI